MSPSSSLIITILRSSNDMSPRTWCNRRRMWKDSLLLKYTAYTRPKALSVTYPEKLARSRTQELSTSSNISDSGAQPGATWPPSPGFWRWYREYSSSPVSETSYCTCHQQCIMPCDSYCRKGNESCFL
ncbi:hypothetical protein TNCV_1794431 [Trichonephila clavipes]|nr:hypothetical protein TNCV_1794431 [Trichonephila clavipes]